jgi:hypothetical protein
MDTCEGTLTIAQNLVIVASLTKVKTIERCLWTDYKVPTSYKQLSHMNAEKLMLMTIANNTVKTLDLDSYWFEYSIKLYLLIHL